MHHVQHWNQEVNSREKNGVNTKLMACGCGGENKVTAVQCAKLLMN